MLLYLLPLDEQNEPKTGCNELDWGHVLQQEIEEKYQASRDRCSADWANKRR